MTAAERMTVWQSPSGQLHGMRRCSGAGAERNMKRRRITRKQFDAAGLPGVPGTHRCRCLLAWRPTP